MPDGYDNDRARKDSNERGRIFENGAYEYFRDHESGYIQGSKKYQVGKDRIKFDKVKEVDGIAYTIEDKSGGVGGRKDETQLRAVRGLIENGQVAHHLLRTVEGEKMSPAARELIDGLARDFPDKFTHQLISRSDAREIFARGLSVEPGEQLEMQGVRSLAVEQRARSKDREKERTQQRVRDWEAAREREARDKQRLALTIEKHRARHEKIAQVVEKRQQRDARERAGQDARDRTLTERKRDVARVVEHNARQIEAAREQGMVFPSQELHDAYRDVVRTMRKVRRAEKAQTREMLRGIGVTGQDAKTMERTLAEGRERNRAELNRGIDTIGAAVAASIEVEAREKTERERQQVLERKHQERQARAQAELDRALQRDEMSPNAYAGFQAVLNSRSREVTETEQRRYDRERAEQGRIKAKEAPGLERGPRER